MTDKETTRSELTAKRDEIQAMIDRLNREEREATATNRDITPAAEYSEIREGLPRTMIWPTRTVESRISTKRCGPFWSVPA